MIKLDQRILSLSRTSRSSRLILKLYERLKEAQIFRFLKLNGCDNQQIGEFSKFVKRRNKSPILAARCF